MNWFQKNLNESWKSLFADGKNPFHNTLPQEFSAPSEYLPSGKEAPFSIPMDLIDLGDLFKITTLDGNALYWINSAYGSGMNSLRAAMKSSSEAENLIFREEDEEVATAQLTYDQIGVYGKWELRQKMVTKRPQWWPPFSHSTEHHHRDYDGRFKGTAQIDLAITIRMIAGEDGDPPRIEVPSIDVSILKIPLLLDGNGAAAGLIAGIGSLLNVFTSILSEFVKAEVSRELQKSPELKKVISEHMTEAMKDLW